MATVRGRPRKGAAAPGSKARSLRLPDAAWEALEHRAAELGVPVHKLLRSIIAEWLYTLPKVESPTPRRRSSHRVPRRIRATA